MFWNTLRAAHSASKQIPDYIGSSGLTYSFQKLIQRRPETGSVWIAQSESRQYILKDIPQSYHLNFTENIWPQLRKRQHPNIRLPFDTVPDERILVYKYLSHDLLELARTSLGSHSRKCILKNVLLGLAELPNHDIVHLDLKPDNMIVECRSIQDGVAASDAVQITDIENAVWLKPGKNVQGILAGNDNWRSPEAHLRAKLNKPTDMFSFGAMCIYVMLQRVIFGPDEDFEYQVSQGIEPGLIRLQRQTCYFGDEAGVQGLRRHFGDDDRLCQLVDAMWEDRAAPYIPYRHFSTWSEVKDEGFQDLVLKMMCLDPQGRITAKEALRHPWFADASQMERYRGAHGWLPSFPDHVKQCMGQSEGEATF